MGSIADGQVQTSKNTIYKVERIAVRLEQVNFFNDNAVAQTIILYIKRKGSTTSRKLRQWILNQNDAGTYLDAGQSLTISNGDVLEAETTTANAVDYLITGDLR